MIRGTEVGLLVMGGLGVERCDVVGVGWAVDAEIFLGGSGVVGFCAVGSRVYHLTTIITRSYIEMKVLIGWIIDIK